MTSSNSSSSVVGPVSGEARATGTPRTFAQSLERALSGLPQKGLAVTGTLASMLGLVPACDPAAPSPAVGSLAQDVIASGQKDWVQTLGTRDTNMVRYYSEFWRDFSNCNSRYGCLSVTVFVKVKVRPTVGADLAYKKIGTVHRELNRPDPITTTGYYFATLPDGMEEWHVPIKSTSHAGAFTFDVWYEDGKGGRFYDDNQGELYALRWVNDSSDFSTLSVDYGSSNATRTAAGVSGTLTFTVADLDYDKQLELVYSTDNWATSTTLGMGGPTDKNKVYWNADLSAEYERWKVDLDLPGAVPSFRYKLIYRHGITAGATPVEFVLGGTSGLVLP